VQGHQIALGTVWCSINGKILKFQVTGRID